MHKCYKINILYILYIYIHTHTQKFSMLDKGLKTQKKRDGEIGEHKLNEMGGLRMKYKN